MCAPMNLYLTCIEVNVRHTGQEKSLPAASSDAAAWALQQSACSRCLQLRRTMLSPIAYLLRQMGHVSLSSNASGSVSAEEVVLGADGPYSKDSDGTVAQTLLCSRSLCARTSCACDML